jgi:hypothetical protein
MKKIRQSTFYRLISILYVLLLYSDIGAVTIPPDSQFSPLFNGSDLSGWHVKAGRESNFSVADSMIIMDYQGGGRGWIETDSVYENFILRCEWKVEAGANSGVICRLGDDAGQEVAYDAIEFQVCDDDDYSPFYHKNDPRELSGAIYGVVAPSEKVFKGDGEWNTYVIICNEDSVTLIYNGVPVIDISVDDYTERFDYWDAMRPSLSERPRSGFIGLQSHNGNRVWYRNIAIIDLNKQVSIQSNVFNRTTLPAVSRFRNSIVILSRRSIRPLVAVESVLSGRHPGKRWVDLLGKTVGELGSDQKYIRNTLIFVSNNMY